MDNLTEDTKTWLEWLRCPVATPSKFGHKPAPLGKVLYRVKPLRKRFEENGE